jgi:hypothetical protein
MTDRKVPSFLKLVEKTPRSKPIGEEDFRVAKWQQSLFALSLPNLMLFIHYEVVSESDFLAAIINARPKYVLDLRIAPRFDLGTLNRQLVFSVFQQVGAQYYDVAGKLGVRSPRDAKLNPSILVDSILASVFRGNRRVEGPIVFLVADPKVDENYETLLARSLDQLTENGWEVLRVPHVIPERKPRHGRELVFISHAAPEDNDFTRWLSARLSSLGYKVWSDVTRLLGGEEFWENIEEAIREHSAKVIVCLSRISQKKSGVLDEVACAVGTERARGLENFVIPVRLDDIPFADVRANVGRKNIIDFSSNWADGLSQLIRVFERDSVPKPGEYGLGASGLIARLQRRPTSMLTSGPETVFANWFRILSLPEVIKFVEYDGPIQDENRVRQLINRPVIGYMRLIGGFVEPEEIQARVSSDVRIRHRCSIPTSIFVGGNSADLPGISGKDARNYLTSLLRQGWDMQAVRQGLQSYQTAAGKNAWYAPKGLIVDGTVSFIGPEGSKKRKNLIGWSERRRVYWHLAMEAVPVLTGTQHFVLRPHVIFTEDGHTPIQSAARMHALRRGFCKSWWNDRWRDLIAGFAAWFANGERMVIEMSDSAFVNVDSRMMMFASPVGLHLPASQPLVRDALVAEPDWGDDPELDESEIAAKDEISAQQDLEEGSNSSADDQ